MNPTLSKTISGLVENFKITDERKATLQPLIDFIQDKKKKSAYKSQFYLHPQFPKKPSITGLGTSCSRFLQSSKCELLFRRN